VQRFWVFVHVAGVLGFLAAHGTSTAVALRLRRERDRVRVQALLDLSRSTRKVNDVSLLLLLGGGIAAGVAGHLWGEGWLWTALILLVGLSAVTVPPIVRHYRRVRVAVHGDSDRELETLLSSPMPVAAAGAGTAVILFILYLMIYQPF